MVPRILFVCKQRNDKYGVSFGLINSCQFVCNALKRFGIEGKTVQVIDNNYIDREVAAFKPTHVFIEALWVVPEKFHVLIPLHPRVKWHVRLHSCIPFLSHEGIALDWLKKYYEEVQSAYPGRFFITANNIDVVRSFAGAFNIPVWHYPNIYYPPEYEHVHVPYNAKSFIDIGCFGAIRPMKNHLYQAIAAITFGNIEDKKIRFHINSNRIEQKGEASVKNIERSFEGTRHELVKHEWMDHKRFIGLVRSMDIGMQVSFSESFNIVAADFVHNNIPIVGSPEIDWLSMFYQAEPTNLESIVTGLQTAYHGKSLNMHWLNKWGLNRYNKRSTELWIDNLCI